MNVLFVARNVFRRLRHDWLTVFMIGTIPLIFILLFGYAFSGNPTDIRVIIVNHDRGRIAVHTQEFGTVTVSKRFSSDLISAFGAHTFRARTMNDIDQAMKQLKAGKAWAVIELSPDFSQQFIDQVLAIRGAMPYTYAGQTVHVMPATSLPPAHPLITLAIDRSNVPVADTVVNTVEGAFNRVLFGYLEHGSTATAPTKLIAVNYVYAKKADYLDYYSPGVIGFAVTVITSMLTLISLVREERNHILERLLTFPVHPWELSLGYTLAFAIIALLQALEVILVAYSLFHTMFAGSILIMLLVITVYTIGLQGMGTLLSSLARNEFQAVQYALLIIIPGMILTEAFWPVEALSPALRPLVYVIPLTYLNRALRAVMLRGWGISGIWFELVVLTAYALVMLGLSILLMKRRAHMK